MRAKSVLFEANLANPGPIGKFYKVELSSMREVERFTDQVMQDTKGKGIDYLVLCAGGPPVGSWRGPTYEVHPLINRLLFATRFPGMFSLDKV